MRNRVFGEKWLFLGRNESSLPIYALLLVRLVCSTTLSPRLSLVHHMIVIIKSYLETDSASAQFEPALGNISKH